jgi:hypothetical protein
MGVIVNGNIVRVAGSFMLRLTANLLSVLMVRFVAHLVIAKQRSSAVEDLAVAPIVVKSRPRCGETVSPNHKICTACKSKRIQEVRSPRELIKLPIEITQDKVFNKRGIPIFVCEFCDAHELEAALAAHQKRIDNK